MKNRFILIIVIALLMACGYDKGGKINEPYDGGHGIGIDTSTVNKIQGYEDSVRVTQ